MREPLAASGQSPRTSGSRVPTRPAWARRDFVGRHRGRPGIFWRCLIGLVRLSSPGRRSHLVTEHFDVTFEAPEPVLRVAPVEVGLVVEPGQVRTRAARRTWRAGIQCIWRIVALPVRGRSSRRGQARQPACPVSSRAPGGFSGGGRRPPGWFGCNGRQTFAARSARRTPCTTRMTRRCPPPAAGLRDPGGVCEG